jgi:peroxiredoxin
MKRRTGIVMVLIAIMALPMAQAQQTTTSSELRGFSTTTRRTLDESTRITDKETGRPLSRKEVGRLMTENPNVYHLEPIFDEYGQASSYYLRPTTAEEKQTGMFNTRDSLRIPKIGEVMPLFVMKDIDNNTYRSTNLKGHVVVLTFLISLNKPFWDARQSKAIDDLIRSSRLGIDPIVLGIMNNSKEEIKELLKTETLPFIPIPDSHGFHQKFSVMSFPSFIVIDKLGNVAAVIEAADQKQLKEVLQKLN